MCPVKNLAFGLILGLALGSGPAGLSAQAATDWYWVKAHGHEVGYLKINTYHDSISGPQASSSPPTGNIITVVESMNRMNRMGAPFNIGSTTRYEENATDASPVRFSYSYHLAEAEASRADGEVHGEHLSLNLQQYDRKSSGTTPIEKNQFSFPTGEKMRQVFQRHFKDPAGSRFGFQTLHLALAPEIVEARVISQKRETLTLPGGKRKELKKFTVINPKDPDHPVYEWRDRDGKLFKALSNQLGTELVYAPGDSLQMLATQSNLLDLMTSTMIRTNRLIPDPRHVSNASYRIRTKGNASEALPQDGRQKITRTDGPDTLLRVTLYQPKNVLVAFPVPVNEPFSESFRERYLAPTPTLQSGDPEIIDLARQITQGEKLSYYAAKKLRNWVYHHITDKDLRQGFASAKETLDTREGDCTEHAVLLAAMARAIGIPARVAVGVEYLPTGEVDTGSFVYHMWTEVYIGTGKKGEWLSLDATNPQASVDATHIKLTDSDLAGANAPVELAQTVSGLMGQLQIDVLEAHGPNTTQVTLSSQSGITEARPQTIDIDRIDIRTLSQKAIRQVEIKNPQDAVQETTMEGQMAQGTEQLLKGNYDAAMALFEKARSKASVAMAHYRLGEQFAALELYPLAREEFQQARKQDPNLAPLTESWIREFFPTVYLSPDWEKQYVTAVAQARQGNAPTEVAETLSGLLEKFPGYTPALLQLAKIQQEQGKKAEALALYQRYISLAPQDPRGPQNLGLAYASAQKFPEALTNLRQAFQRSTAFNTPAGRQLRTDLRNQIWFTQGKALLAKNPKNPSGWLLVGKSLYYQKRPLEALSAFNSTLKTYPASPAANTWKLKILMENGYWEEAATWAPRVSRYAAATSPGQNALGYYQMRNRNYPLAIKLFNRAIALDPENAEATLNLSQTYERQRNLDKATATLERAMPRITAIDARSFQSGLDLRQALAERLLRSQPNRAYGLIKEILVRNPVDTSALALEGRLRLNQNQLADAKIPLSDALLLAPYNPDILSLLGDLYSLEDNPNEALYYYQKALKVFPGHPAASRSLALLIEEHRMNRQKPKLYLELTADEKDYLKQLESKVAILKRESSTFNQEAQSLSQERGSNYAEYKQTGLDMFDSIYNVLLGYYQWAEKTTPPTRFQQLHLAFANAVYATMQYFHETEVYYAGLSGPPSVEGYANSPSAEAAANLKTVSEEFEIMNSAIMNKLNPLDQSEMKEVVLNILPEAQGKSGK